MAISVNGLIDEVYVRQAIDFLLKECLPPDDYESDAERYVFREIVVKVLLSSVVPRITEPWFIHKLILDLIGPEKDALSENSDTPRHASLRLNQTPQRRALSFQSLAIFFLSAIQSFSGACLALIHAYRQTRDTIRRVNVSTTRFPHQQSPDATPDSTPRTERDVTTEAPTVASSEVPGGLKSSLSPASFTSPLTLPRLSQPPPVSAIPHDPISRSTSSASTPSAASFSGSSHAIPTHPPSPSDYTHPPLALLLTILFPPPTPPSTSSAGPGTSSRSTALALAYTLSLPLTALSPFLSRLLPYLLYTHVLSVDRVTDIVRIARRALFPEGWPIPPPVDPTPEEQTALREELGRRLLASVPGPLVVLLGPTPTARSHTIDAALAPLSSRECNAHLMLFILDLILLTVFPEMGASVSENTDAGMGGEERLP
ncbi:predicted protein [Sparassis crispa]|uniref:PXA domain-containing protein n=1 Tax=Sparassis crispa TaxID=139825 RepID=A0A401G7L9_9APHY|nr:predicted protein [Sparassis crispa]GBE78161.1 predicted protein [Sparassis crispa]